MNDNATFTVSLSNLVSTRLSYVLGIIFKEDTRKRKWAFSIYQKLSETSMEGSSSEERVPLDTSSICLCSRHQNSRWWHTDIAVNNLELVIP